MVANPLEPAWQHRLAAWVHRPVVAKMMMAVGMAFFVACLVGLRGRDFDRDFEVYQIFFDELRSYPAGCLRYPNYEPIFSCLFYGLSPLGMVGALFVIVWLALSVKFYVVLDLDVGAFALFIPIYVTSFFLIHELNQTRLAIALAPMYWVYRSRVLGRPVGLSDMLCIILATLMHYSVSVLGLLLLISPTGIMFYLVLGGLALVVYGLYETGVLMTLVELVGDDRIRGYFLELMGNDSGGGLNFLNAGTVAYMFLMLLVGSAIMLMRKNLRYPAVYSNFMYLMVVSFVMYFVLVDVPVVANRMVELMRAFSPFVVAMMIADASRQRGGLFLGVMIACAAFLGISFLLYGPAVLPVHQMLAWLGLVRDI